MSNRVGITLVPYEGISITVRVTPSSGGKYAVQVAGVAVGERAFDGKVAVKIARVDDSSGTSIYNEEKDFLISSSYPPQVWNDEITPEVGAEYKVTANASSSFGTDDGEGNFTVPAPTSAKLYGSRGTKATQLSKVYLPVDGKAKQINKIYGSVNGQTKLIFNHFTAPPPASH